MAKPELGGKRQCQNCGTKFFDLMRSPIVCPKCGTVFQVVAAAVPRTVAARVAQSEEEAEPETGTVEMVPLEEADAAEEKTSAVKKPAADDDIEIEEDANDEPFLEEEEEDNDDVADLIDGDIHEDEES